MTEVTINKKVGGTVNHGSVKMSNNSGSKYAIQKQFIDDETTLMDEGAEGQTKQLTLELSQKRNIDRMNLQIKQKKANPLDKNLIITQAKQDLDSKRKQHARNTQMQISEAEANIKITEDRLTSAKKRLIEVTEIAKEQEERANLLAEQEYNKLISSTKNVDELMALQIQKIEMETADLNQEIQIELDNIKIVNEIHAKKLEALRRGYKDLIAISMHIGDAK